jgi:hypothetical protein
MFSQQDTSLDVILPHMFGLRDRLTARRLRMAIRLTNPSYLFDYPLVP